jgi:hypothetical protein
MADKTKKTIRKAAKQTAAKAKDTAPSIARTIHHRVTAARNHRSRTLPGMHPTNAMTQAGATAHFDVSYLTKLGQKGATLAAAILQNCERDFMTLQQTFGGITPQRLPFAVQITSDNTGASHSSCMGTDISVGGQSAANVDFIRSLLVAEADEVFMANFGHGWDCGASNGEGLSRVLANDIYQGVEPANFISSSVWLSMNPRPNFVDQTNPTDTNYPSIGCSVLFLNWLRFQLNYSWAKIIGAGAATLSATYRNLTQKPTGWTDFTAVIDTKFPPGPKYDLATDNPFPL